MLDDIALKVRLGGFLVAEEESSERACGPFVCSCLCDVFSFIYVCILLTCFLFNQLSTPRPAFGTSLGLVKLAHFPLFCVSPFFYFSLLLPSQPLPSLFPDWVAKIPTQSTTNSLTASFQKHRHTQSITNTKPRHFLNPRTV